MSLTLAATMRTLFVDAIEEQRELLRSCVSQVTSATGSAQSLSGVLPLPREGTPITMSAKVARAAGDEALSGDPRLPASWPARWQLAAIGGAADGEALQALRVKYLGRKSALSESLREVGKLDAKARADAGARANRVKRAIEDALLANRTIDRIERRGKQLAIVANDGATMCVHLGIRAKGRVGGLLAGLGFMLPGFALMMGLSWLYFAMDIAGSWLGAAFLGVQAAVVALIVRAVHRIGEHILADRWLWGIAITCAAAAFALCPWVGRRPRAPHRSPALKAALFRQHGALENLVYEDVADPEPAPDECLIRVQAVALNGFDPMILRGIPGLRTPLPMVPGADIAGQTSVNVNRVFADLERQGLIRRDGRQIHFQDWPEMRRVASFQESYLE